MTTVRPIAPEDHDAWLPLWEGYLSFYRAEPTTAWSEDLFARLLQADQVAGLVAVDSDGDGGLIGLSHLVFHASTWSAKPRCYLNDLFVGRAGRGSGAGKALIEATYAAALERGCDEVYWHTQEFNYAARSLYDTVGSLTSFRVYEHTLDG